MTTRKFNDHVHAQAYIIDRDSGDKELISYTTRVCAVYGDWLVVYGLYSATTRKHIGWFMKELGFDYQTAKHLYDNDLMMNIYTGEVK